MRLTRLKRKIRRATDSQRVRLVATMLVFAVFGVVFLWQSFAAGPMESLQPEQGTRSGNLNSINDGSASNGGYVQFGSIGGVPYAPPSGYPLNPIPGVYFSTLGVSQNLLPYRTSTTSIWNKPLPDNTPTTSNSASQVSDFARLARQGGGRFPWPAYFEGEGNAPQVYLVDSDVVPFVKVNFHCTGNSTWWNYNAAEFENYINNAYPGKYGVPIPPNLPINRDNNGEDSPLAIYDYKKDIQFNFWVFENVNGTYRTCWGGHSGGSYVGIKEPNRCSAGSTPARFSEGNGTFCWPFGEDTAGFTDLGTNITFDDMFSGSINHAIAISIPHVRSDGYSYPATRYNGWCTSGNFEGASSLSNCLYIGQRLRLPANYNTSQISNSHARILAEAVKKYGFIIHDTGGGISIQMEGDVGLTARGLPSPWDTYFGGWSGKSAAIQAFPWEALQVLPKDYQW